MVSAKPSQAVIQQVAVQHNLLEKEKDLLQNKYEYNCLIWTEQTDKYNFLKHHPKLKINTLPFLEEEQHHLRCHALVLDLTRITFSIDPMIDWIHRIPKEGQVIAIIDNGLSDEDKSKLLCNGIDDYIYIDTLSIDVLYEMIFKYNQKKYNQQNHLLKQVIDSNPNPIFVKDKDGRYILVNQALANRHRMVAKIFIGKTDLQLIAGLGYQEAMAYAEQDRKLLEHQGDLLLPEEVIIDKEGKQRTIKTIKRILFGDKNEAKYILGVSMDITEIRKTEEDLRQIHTVIENSSLVFFKCQSNSQGEFVDFSFLSQNMTRYGFKPEALVEGSINFLEDIFHPEDIAATRQEIRNTVIRGDTKFTLAFRIYTQEREVRCLEVRATVVKVPKSSGYNLQGFFLDITDKET